ncbi:hypothetical protein ACHAXT_005732 [Thalassiosira profunda]
MASDPPAKRPRTDGEEDGGSSDSPAVRWADGGPPAKTTTNGLGDDDGDVLAPLAPGVLDRSAELAASYKSATPYPHGMIKGFCREGFLADEILEELKQNSKVKFKETDLFRVYQSIDLGNLSEGSELALQMPALMKLKRAIYSPEYRAFVERVTGLEAGTLTDEVDCAANCHAKGCHLLCHDDVIGNRKVSYIIYLTDPEPTWTDVDGGRLELYEAVAENPEIGESSRRVPGALPVKTILPEFNAMACFEVRPGVSFHSVQEVFCDRPRLSLQGWYHSKEAPREVENATLQRLKSTDKGEDMEGAFEPLETTGEKGGEGETNQLSEEDRSFLGNYINAAYLSNQSMEEMRERFEEESSIQLRHFLIDEWNAKMSGAFAKEDARDNLGKDRPSLNYNVGTSNRWKAVGPAHKQRFLQYDPKEGTAEDCDAGHYLHFLRQTVFQSTAFGRWLGWITSLGFPLGHRGRVRRFRPGLDYTVAHYGVLTIHAVLDATLCFCAGEGKQCSFDEETNELIGSDDDAIWESGDVGGFECYIAADEGGEEQGPDAEYDEEDDTKLLSVSASNNTLSLVYRDPGTMRFVKYVGAGAPSSRWDVALEYNVKSDESDDEEGGDETDPNKTK